MNGCGSRILLRNEIKKNFLLELGIEILYFLNLKKKKNIFS